VIRLVLSIFVALSIAAPAFSEEGVSDPLFAKVHFDQWVGGKGQSPFKWTVQAQPVALSPHQRLLAHVDVDIDGAEMESRRGRGALFVLFQFQDSAGRFYQDHGIIDLTKVQAGAKSQVIVYTESAFVMPGNYPVSIGIFDTNTSEHWLRRDTLHVPNGKSDPLPFASRDLPEIEFMPPQEPPDSWYLPTVEGRLHLPLDTRHPLKVEILVNLTPSERATGSQRTQDRNLSVLLPTLKALAQMDLKSGALGVESVDLTRQKISFRQDSVRHLDWQKMRVALTGDQPGTIDVKSLADREHSAQFFVSEVRKRIRAADALIILSSSIRFEQGIDLEPIHAEGTPDCRVFYVRYHPPPAHYLAQPNQPLFVNRRSPMANRGAVMQVAPPIIDQLEPTLKPLAHRLFDVQSPEEMRKALADMLAELSVL
jgi:hypothetical protein